MLRQYYVYIFTNRFRTEWCVGITSDLDRMVEDRHASLNKWNCFSKWFQCIHLVYYEAFPDIRDAIKAEHEIKSWNYTRKKSFVRSKNPGFNWIVR
jgi:putative endonuclease